MSMIVTTGGHRTTITAMRVVPTALQGNGTSGTAAGLPAMEAREINGMEGGLRSSPAKGINGTAAGLPVIRGRGRTVNLPPLK
jgi:hypothetical protein